MILYTPAASDRDVKEILQLQQRNIPALLGIAEMQSQKFVTIIHSFALLKKMNATEPSIVAKVDGKVIAYLLAMARGFSNDIPVLIPMFQLFEKYLLQEG